MNVTSNNLTEFLNKEQTIRYFVYAIGFTLVLSIIIYIIVNLRKKDSNNATMKSELESLKTTFSSINPNLKAFVSLKGVARRLMNWYTKNISTA